MKGKFGKTSKVSKYYETDCLQNFLLLFMLLLTTAFVKNSHIKARNFLTFVENVLKQTWNSFNTKFQTQLKDCESRKQLSRKRNFRTFLSINCSNFRFKQDEKH